MKTADGLSPTPMSISWVRDGLFMCGMDNEISVFSQWKESAAIDESKALKHEVDSREKDIVEHRNLQEADLINLAQVRNFNPLSRPTVTAVIIVFTHVVRPSPLFKI